MLRVIAKPDKTIDTAANTFHSHTHELIISSLVKQLAMADLEKVLADMSLIRALEEKKASTKFILPDPSVRHVMIRHMEKTTGISFNNIFNQQICFLLFKEFCM